MLSCNVIGFAILLPGYMGNSNAVRRPLKWRLADRTALPFCDITKFSLKIVARPFAFGPRYAALRAVRLRRRWRLGAERWGEELERKVRTSALFLAFDAQRAHA